MPANTQVYVELPSIKRSLFALRGVKFLDEPKIDEKKIVDDTVAGIAKSFDLSPDDARNVAFSLDSMGLAMRGLEEGKKPEALALIEFSSSGAAKALLASKRFASAGAFGASGQAYTLQRRDPLSTEPPPVEAALGELRSDPANKLVWFSKRNLLAIGHEAMLKDLAAILDDGKDSLASSEQYKQAAKDFESGAELVAFIDSVLFKKLGDASTRKLVDGYLKDAGPIVTSLKFVDSGLMLHIHGLLGGTLTANSKDSPWASPSKLKLPEKLPKDTVAYLAFSTKTSLKGAEMRERALGAFTEIDPDKAATTKQGVAEFEKQLGLELSTVFDAMGDEAILGLTVDSAYKPSILSPPSPTKDLAIVFAQHVRDSAAAKKIVGVAKSKVGELLKELYSIKDIGDGFDAEPVALRDKFPLVQVRLVGDTLLVLAGARPLNDKALQSLEGKGALKDDAGHALALRALTAPSTLFWMDTGRIGQAALDLVPGVRSSFNKGPVPVEAVLLTGERRITTALGFAMTRSGDRWRYDAELLNGMGLAALASAATAASGAMMGTALDLPTTPAALPTPTGDLDSIPACKAYFEKFEACVIKKVPAASRTAMRKSMETMRTTWGSLPADSATVVCGTALQSLKTNPSCR
jgi:hypothetical protein